MKGVEFNAASFTRKFTIETVETLNAAWINEYTFKEENKTRRPRNSH